MTGTDRREPLRHAGATRLAAAAAVLLLAAAAAGVYAQSPEQDAQPPAPAAADVARRATGNDDRQLMRALNLTPEQRTEIARIRRETEQQNRVIGQRVRRSRRALEETIYSPSVDEQAVDELAREVAAGEAARVRLRAQTELRIRRLLTPEQLEVFRELRRRAMRRGRQNLQPGRPVNTPGREPQEGRFPAASRPNYDPAPAQTITPRERRRAARTRRAPLRRPLP